MKADEYDQLFKNGDLTHLMITKKGDRNKIPKHLSYPLYKLLKTFLGFYGIWIGGAVHIDDYEVTAVTIGPSFDLENEVILQQLYDFTGGRVNIQLAIDKGSDDIGAYAFWYDLKDYSCTFEKYVYGETKESIEFDNLAAMLHYIKRRWGKQVIPA